MNDLGLFTIEKRVQPALPESYIVTIKISEEPKGFFTRLYSIYQNNRIYLTKEIKKKLFKEDSIIWKASFEPPHDRKGMEISKHHEFRRIMAFNFRTEIEMIDALYTLESFLDEVISKEFIEFQVAVNADQWQENV
ncbi:hypothetical protein MKZ21_30620 [Paenibacillus sp. FSL P2-0536]|uniref:hypothetical protein n=1 Tax=Paenibacillus sp. FSL P2-0536 TaxID=2921629 RepID=UPI0030F6F9D5